MIEAATTFGVAVASALLPFVNIELYLAGIGALGGPAVIGLALVAAAGQTVGKIVWYEIARRSLDSPRVQRKLASPKMQARHQRWSARMEGRPWYAAVIIFLAASAGIPPLLIMAVIAGALRMPRVVYIPTVFVGRFLRFWGILAGVGFLVK